MNELENIFKKSNVRLTNPRQLVFETLEKTERPLTISEIINQNPEVDRVSVYRIIKLFDELKIIKIIPFGFKKLYELTEPFKEHHHHLHCVRCNQIKAIYTPNLEKFIAKIASKYNYKLTNHHIELEGICKKCS